MARIRANDRDLLEADLRYQLLGDSGAQSLAKVLLQFWLSWGLRMES